MAAAGILLLLSGLALLGRPRDPAPPIASSEPAVDQPTRNPGYVGPDRCATCHADRVAEFRQTNHFRTCRVPLAEEMPDGFDAGRGRYSTRDPAIAFEMKSNGDRFVQETIRTSASGESRLETPIALVLGAGFADDVYLSWHDDGTMFELPVAWLWGQNTWGVSHFFHPQGEGDFSRPLTVRCLECHTTWVDVVPGRANQYHRDGAILGVTCERCHGPGREHSDYHEHNPRDVVAKAIVKPMELDRERRIELCTQCHSNAITHREAPFHYRPGESLDESYRTLRISHPENDHVANQIDGLRQSVCFQQTEMTCVTCHDPHHRRAPESAAMESCRQCHETADCTERPRLDAVIQDRCIDCHMPQRIKINVKFETEHDNFVPAVKRFDHRIAVHPDARDTVVLRHARTRTESSGGEVANSLARSLTRTWLDRAAGHRGQHRYLAAIADVRESLEIEDSTAARMLLSELVAVQTGLYDDWSLALHEIRQNRLESARTLLQGILTRTPEDAEVHSKLGTIAAVRGEKELAREHLMKVLELDPDNAAGPGVLGRMAYRDGNYDEAVKYWRHAEEIEPFHAGISFDLAQAFLKLGRSSQAIGHLEKTVRIDPTRIEVWIQLSDTLAHTGRDAEALEVAEKALPLARGQRSTLRQLQDRIERLKGQAAP